MTVIRTFKKHLVQTATAWGTWVDQVDLEAPEVGEGAGQFVGSGSLRLRTGMVRRPGVAGNPSFVTPLTAIIGQWVRVLIQQASGSVSAQGDTWEPLWHGEVMATILPDEGGGLSEQAVSCLGITNALSRLVCNRGLERRWSSSGGGPDNLIDAGYMPPFNGEPMGDMHSADVDIDGTGPVCRAFTRGKPGQKWTAFQIIRYLLACHARGQTAPAYIPACPLVWTISDPANLLSFTPTSLDLNGMKLLDALNVLMNPRRGLTWSVVVTGNSAVITPESTSPVAIVNGGYTLTAATRTITPDLSSSHFQSDVQVIEDQGSTYDVIRVIGSRPWVAVTLVYDSAGIADVKALQKGWTGPEEIIFGRGGAIGNNGAYRRWTILDTWDGSNQSGIADGLRNNVTLVGTRTHSTSDTWQPQSMELTPELPCSLGFSTLAKGPRQPPVVVVYNGNCYLPMTGGAIVDAYYQMPVQVEQQPPAIWVGVSDADAAKMRDLIGSSAMRLYITVGIRESTPLFVEWQRGSSGQPRDLPRTLTLNVPDCEEWVALKGCVTGCTQDGTGLLTLASDVSARNDISTLQQTLALMRAYYAEPGRSVSWFDAGTIDRSATNLPGALLTTTTFSTGTVAVNATLTTRRWSLTEDRFGTTYDAQRLFSPMDVYR